MGAPGTVTRDHGPAAVSKGWALRLAPAALPLLLVGLLALMPPLMSPQALLDVQSVVGLALFACATNLLVGYGGLVSFGQAAFYGLGAYVVALAWMHLKTSFWASFAAAPFVGAAAALLVGVVALRTRRLYFALLTLAFSELFYVIVQQQVSFTGGANGIFGPMLPSALLGSWNAYYFTLVVAAIALAALWKITASPFGLTLRAIRENRERAEALGVNVFRHQLLAFVFAGFFCALAGTLFVVHDQSANPDLLDWTQSGYPLFMAIIGGQFVFLGPAVGALVYVEGKNAIIAHFSSWQLVFGALLLAVVLFAPDGILGALARAYRWSRSRGRRERAEKLER